MISRLVGVAIAAVLAGRTLAAAAAPEPSGEARAAQIERAREQVLDPSYQAELPRDHADPQWGERTAQPGQDASRRPRTGTEPADRSNEPVLDVRDRDRDGGEGSTLMSALMWGLVIVIGVLLISWLASELFGYGGDAELGPVNEPEVALKAATAAIIDRPLADADELAQRGEFADAIHVLLLRTLQELVRSAAVRVAPAMTSREILARVPLLADARTALSGLITAVEITYFGDEPANAADYDRCRQQFHVFAQALRGRPAARAQAVAA